MTIAMLMSNTVKAARLRRAHTATKTKTGAVAAQP